MEILLTSEPTRPDTEPTSISLKREGSWFRQAGFSINRSMTPARATQNPIYINKLQQGFLNLIDVVPPKSETPNPRRDIPPLVPGGT
jgi:hypothetical protein